MLCQLRVDNLGSDRERLAVKVIELEDHRISFSTVDARVRLEELDQVAVRSSLSLSLTTAA